MSTHTVIRLRAIADHIYTLGCYTQARELEAASNLQVDVLDALRTLTNAAHILWLEASEEGQPLTRAETDAAAAIEYARATIAQAEAT